MNSKLKTMCMLLAGMALGLTSCKSDDPFMNGGENGDEYSGQKVYISAGISLPSAAGTRSATDGGKEDGEGETNSNAAPDDYEYGYDYENDVRTMILMFTNTKDQFLCYSVVDGLEKAPTGNPNYEFEVLAEVKYEDLQKAYTGNFITKSDSIVNVYAYCNYTANLENLFKAIEPGSTDWKDWSGSVEESASPAGSSPTLDNTIWASRAFLMTNYTKTKTAFPATLDGWNEYADRSFPFYVTAIDNKQIENGQRPELSPIQVERTAARFDFRDASPEGDQVYPVLTSVHVYETVEGDDGSTETVVREQTDHNFFNVKLTRMSLVNMSKNFYYLRRVSDDGTSAGTNFALLGREGRTNYVVDTDADAKKANSIKTGATGDLAADKHFNFCLYMKDDLDPNGTAYNRDGWYVDRIVDVISESKNKDTWKDRQYKIWRYVTENTIPGAENQKTVQSTGVVFKGRITAGDEISSLYKTTDEIGRYERYISEKVEDALANKVDGTVVTKPEDLPILYCFDGFLYAGWEELIEKGALDGKGGRLFTRVEKILKDYKLDETGKVYKKGGEGTVLDMETAYLIVTKTADNVVEEDPHYRVKDLSIDMKDTDIIDTVAANHGITVYKASNDDDDGLGYYCYYFYWNRHNDNDKSGLMGPMEFATVRNNVYKLSVSKINKFGHPRVKRYDPDPQEEDRDDEDPLRYIQVDVEVLPWVVRVNDIQF